MTYRKITKISTALVALIILTSLASAQDDDVIKIYLRSKGSNGEKVRNLLIASALSSLTDYVGYNLTKNNQQTLVLYRVIQTTFNATLTYYLYHENGLSTALAFQFVWWTGGHDFMYYGWAEILSIRGWEGRGSFSRVVREGASHLYWTPIGLSRGGINYRHAIAGNTLLAQAVGGFTLALTVSISF